MVGHSGPVICHPDSSIFEKNFAQKPDCFSQLIRVCYRQLHHQCTIAPETKKPQEL